MQIRDRIQGLRRVPARELKANPKNWRALPKAQREAMQGILAEIGYADALLARELEDGTLELLDGHLRAETTPDADVPVLILDLDDAEAQKLLAVLDPLASMAEADHDVLRDLLAGVTTENESLKAMLDDLLQSARAPGSFRAAAGYLAAQIDDWREAEAFFTCPDDVRAELEGRNYFVVEFSGGKDSLSTLLWLARVLPDKRRIAAYVETGVEFPGMGAYVRDVATELGAEPAILKPELEWWSWLAELGEWPSLLYRPCMAAFIHQPWSRWVREKFPAEETAVFTGSRAEEAVRGSKKTATSALASLGADAERIFHFAPCFNVKKPTLEKVLEQSGVPLWEGYARGFVRTACWCCPGQCGEQACALQDNYPGLAEDIRRWEKRIGPIRPLAKRGKKQGCTFDDVVRAGRKRLEAQPKPASASEAPPKTAAAPAAKPPARRKQPAAAAQEATRDGP